MDSVFFQPYNSCLDDSVLGVFEQVRIRDQDVHWLNQATRSSDAVIKMRFLNKQLPGSAKNTIASVLLLCLNLFDQQNAILLPAL